MTKKIFDYILAIFLTLSPIIFVFGNNPYLNGWVAKFQFYQFNVINAFDVSLVQFMFFELGVLILFLASLFTKQLREFKDYWISTLYGFCIISLLFHPEGVKVIGIITSGFLLYYIIYTHVNDLKILIWPFVIVSTLNTIFAILQKFGIHFIYTTTRCDGVMFLSSHMGFYQAIALPLCYLLNPYLVIIPIIGLVLAGSFIPQVAGLIVMTYLLFRQYNIVSIPFIAGYIIFLAIVFYNIKPILYKLYIRGVVWLETIRHISLFGNGVGNFKYNMPTIGITFNPYSIYLSVYYSLGIVGLSVFCLMIRSKILKYNESSKDFALKCIFSSFLAILICGISQSFLDFPRLAVSCIAIFAFLNLLLTKGETHET